ncbi:MAG: CPBP family intramembrane metalloprotease [Clostridiales bacterium]|nr:CPBP family intramembrane metalloprotease [Clostridiales bacterium]
MIFDFTLHDQALVRHCAKIYEEAGIVFKNKYREPRAGYITVIALLFFKLRGVAVLPLQQFKESDAPLQALLYDLIPTLVAIIIDFLLFRLIYRKSVNAIGLYRKKSVFNYIAGSGVGILFISLVFFILLAASAVAINATYFGAIATVGFYVSLISMVFATFGEELLFRGVMMTAFKTTRNKWIILFVPAFLFGIVHATNPGATPLAIINIFIAGLFLSYAFMKTGNLLFTSGIHFTWNFFQSIVYGSPVSGISMKGALLDITSKDESALFNGGAFGFEAGLLCPAVFLFGGAAIYLLYRNTKSQYWDAEAAL